MPIARPTAADVKAYRDKHQCSMEAKATVRRDWRRARLDVLRAQAGVHYGIDHLQRVVADLIELLQEVENDRG